ncbi:transcription factor bHLH18-like [Benincasa hispida]|uniref:transcription factor bHLH18-like n=1 Tax=Benincasa hispida TaxID=102211 RepID=UPI0019011146|nr:transcription factor bHLH18-like [Benincasa hispida]
MEISSARWISEWEIEDPPSFMDEFKVDPFDFSLDEFKFEEYSGGSWSGTDFYESPVPPSAVTERPTKQLKVAVDGGIKCQIFDGNYKADSSSSTSQIISFENFSNSKCGKGSVGAKIEMDYESVNISESYWNNNEKSWKKCSSSMNRNPLHAREHVIAERKRREKLSQRFIALSALIPGLNKVDKASILGGAIRHVKELQERLKVVEEQPNSKMSEAQSTACVKRTSLQVSSPDDESDDNSFTGGPAPEIEARFSNKDVLIRIHCQKRKGCLSYLLNKIENLNNLTILNTSALPFGHSKLDITIVAQVDVGFCLTVEDVVKNLRQALLDFH